MQNEIPELKPLTIKQEEYEDEEVIDKGKYWDIRGNLHGKGERTILFTNNKIENYVGEFNQGEYIMEMENAH